jgi:hypothetical protein
MSMLPASIYLLCLATAAVCAWLLLRQYRRTRSALLFWSALCFAALTCNNLFLVLDTVIFPDIDFLAYRQVSAFVAVAVLLYGFIWEAD